MGASGSEWERNERERERNGFKENIGWGLLVLPGAPALDFFITQQVSVLLMRPLVRVRARRQYTGSHDQIVIIYNLDAIDGCGCQCGVCALGLGSAFANHAEHPGSEEEDKRTDADEAIEAGGVT